MKFNEKYEILYTLIIVLLFSTQNYAQVLCGLGNKNVIHETTSNREYSGLAYHTERSIFFMPVDAPITINNKLRHIVGYDQNGNIFYPTFSNLAELVDDDLEGLTYLEQDYFILVEEDLNYVYFLEYNVANKEFTILSRHDVDIDLGSTGDGLEGITYDPHTSRLFLVREHEETELFSIPIIIPNATFTGTINIAQKKSIILSSTIFSDNNPNTDNDASGLFHLGKVVEASSQLSNNLLILSEGLKKVVEFDVLLDGNNNLSSINYVGEKSISSENQPEGIVVVNGEIYIASEVGNSNPATLSTYSLQNNILTCKILDTNCNCLDNPGCTDDLACNFDAFATEDDGSCLYANTSCDDGNQTTVNDIRDINCNCSGEVILGCTDDLACNYDASATQDDGSCLYANTSCDDGNQTTVNDIRDINCNCSGEVILGCTDYLACNYDASATLDSGSCFYKNSSCDDGNSDTTNDTYNATCTCIGVDICLSELEDEGTIAQGIYQVSNFIESTGIIGENQMVTYDAGKYVHLDKGFLADANEAVTFLAKIEGCPQLRELNFIERTTSIKNFPNPFTGETTIEFELKADSEISLFVSNVNGKTIATILDNEMRFSGTNQHIFSGQHLTPGIYYCTLISSGKVSTQKMILMK